MMTELEALKKVLETAEWADEEMAEPGKPDLASALPLVKALIARVEEAEQTTAHKQRLAEEVLAQTGVTAVTFICASDVREQLLEQGFAALAQSLSDETIIQQVDFIMGKRELPAGFSDWRLAVECDAAEALAEANGLTWPEELP
jgi:hypothetical protein